MATVGIIGFGNFGLFLAEQLDVHCRVLGYSRSGRAGKWSADLEDVAAADYVILSIPLNAYEETLHQIKPFLKPGALLLTFALLRKNRLRLFMRYCRANRWLQLIHCLDQSQQMRV